MNKNNIQKNRGYTLLFSVLISSLLLTIGLAILMISKKEILLSSSGRESQFAFYAADTGVECAMYSDFGANGGAFSNKLNFVPDIKCNKQNIPVGTPTPISIPPSAPSGVRDVIRFNFNIALDRSGNISLPLPCAKVMVDKYYSTDADYHLIKTVIQSRGYNTGCSIINDPRKVERGLRVAY